MFFELFRKLRNQSFCSLFAVDLSMSDVSVDVSVDSTLPPGPGQSGQVFPTGDSPLLHIPDSAVLTSSDADVHIIAEKAKDETKKRLEVSRRCPWCKI